MSNVTPKDWSPGNKILADLINKYDGDYGRITEAMMLAAQTHPDVMFDVFEYYVRSQSEFVISEMQEDDAA